MEEIIIMEKQLVKMIMIIIKIKIQIVKMIKIH